MKALQSLDSYKERGIPLHAWLFVIAGNVVIAGISLFLVIRRYLESQKRPRRQGCLIA